jgi:hypothetical protein
MAFIYFATQLTIVAAAGRDTDHGLRCRKKTGSMVPPEVSVGDVSLLPYLAPFQYANVRDSAWASRAWTFQ